MSHNFALIDEPVFGTTPGYITAWTAKAARSVLLNNNLVSFQSISMPSVELQTKEIQEGNWPMTHYVALGPTSPGQVTVSHAVFPEGIDMFLWIRQCIFGIGAPRRNLLVLQLGIDKLIPRRVIRLEKCIPISWKVSSDLDALAPSVALEELTFQVEDVDFVI